jgi:hypothetical protein
MAELLLQTAREGFRYARSGSDNCRAGIGDDEPHRLQAKLLKAIDLTTKILNGVFNPNVMGLQKSVELVAGTKPEEAAQFILGEMTALVFLQRQCLQRPA